MPRLIPFHTASSSKWLEHIRESKPKNEEEFLDTYRKYKLTTFPILVTRPLSLIEESRLPLSQAPMGAEEVPIICHLKDSFDILRANLQRIFELPQVPDVTVVWHRHKLMDVGWTNLTAENAPAVLRTLSTMSNPGRIQLSNYGF